MSAKFIITSPNIFPAHGPEGVYMMIGLLAVGVILAAGCVLAVRGLF
jgi:hypothetical protein